MGHIMFDCKLIAAANGGNFWGNYRISVNVEVKLEISIYRGEFIPPYIHIYNTP